MKLLRYYLGRPIGSVDHMLHWQVKLDVKVVKRVKEHVRSNSAKRPSETQKDDEEGSPEARKKKKSKQADKTQTPPPK